MRQNENLVLIGSKVILVPYKEEHVLKYHDWMQSPFLQEMTASEPLTLDEEYAMQRSWHEDEKKCTFILLAAPDDKNTLSSFADMKEGSVMIGDVNIFLNDQDDDPTFGEIEIMIAEERYRRGGRGLEALKITMAYATTELGLKTFHAKISLTNEPSIDLFTRKLGFYPVSTSQVFQETTLEWSCLPKPSSPPASGIDDDDSSNDAYGAKATDEQRQRNHAMRDALIEFWTTHVKKDRWP
ncbi:GNAT domain-containing protein [Zychaea mexicana]|uniref:GNAT domain-containing protein n=1 Tax=Zychaea mexicana TaxID=64656 RepID=UPI0022FE337B|nr:GNAT domain-containing protein [Zychaea mexicana]KAI9493879.1 GNAT domain-containing protein [Zychaea mexicana]